MSFQRKGIENHTPLHKLPRLPIGLHVCKIVKAHQFVSKKTRQDGFATDMIVLDSDDKALVGRKFGFVKMENEFSEYYLACVREFIAAALGVDIEDVDADLADEAINEQDASAGLATGQTIVVEVMENTDNPEYPNVSFSAYVP